jgi:hypothetical protein
MSYIVVNDKRAAAMIERNANVLRAQAIRQAHAATRPHFIKAHASLLAGGAGIGLLLSLAAMLFGIV